MQRVIKTAEHTIGIQLSISDICELRCLHSAQQKLKASLFTLLLSGKRYRSIHCPTIRVIIVELMYIISILIVVLRDNKLHFIIQPYVVKMSNVKINESSVNICL